jgi:hypothetical protein
MFVEKAFETLLNAIISLKPPERLAKVKPQLQSLLSHPTILLLLSGSKVPATTGTPAETANLASISKALTSLSKAVECLQKANTTSKPPPPSPQAKQQKDKDTSKPPPRSYLAIAGSRPPNPSLMVDLANVKYDADSWPKLEVIC